jgi:Cd(II)/Pb(II)-responsive transcriptional regulator
MQLKIKELAKKIGLSIDTIRFYEKKGLIPPPLRGDNNYRYYDEEAYKKLIFIKHCRDLDISIQEILQLNELLQHPEQNCNAVNHIIDQHLIDIQHKINSFINFQKQLQALRQTCHDNNTIEHCQIIKKLEEVHA